MTVLFYISSHGFGHATRTIALTQEFIKIGIYCIFSSDRPSFLFRNLNKKYFKIRNKKIDFGLVHKNWAETDFSVTLTELKKIINRKEQIFTEEIEYCKRNNIDLIISDIPFLPFEVADRLNIYSIAVSNFNWFYIYDSLNKHKPHPILNEIKKMYLKADKTLRLPFSSPKSMIDDLKTIKTGILAKNAIYKKSETRRRYKIPKNHKIVLLTLRPGDKVPIEPKDILKKKNIILISKFELKHKNHRKISADTDFSALIGACDLIISKTGYSTLAESVQANKAVIYFNRLDFPEDKILINEMKNYPKGYFIPYEKLSNVDWSVIIDNVLKLKAVKKADFYNRNLLIAQKIIWERFKSMDNKLVAIDVGTNNILLLWAYFKNKELKVAHQVSKISGLGKGLENGYLAKDAIKRAKKILTDYIIFSRSFSSKIVVTGTSCSRESKNINLLTKWLKKFDIDFRILTDDEEAYYNGYANLHEFSFPKILTFDLGGGSTEFTEIDNGKIIATSSVNLGLRRLQDKFGDNLDFKLGAAKRILKSIRLENSDFELIGIGGTVITLVFIKNYLEASRSSKIHGQPLSLDDLSKIENFINNSTFDHVNEIIPFEIMNPEFLIFGLTIIKAIMNRFEKDKIYVSEKGLRFGILKEIFNNGSENWE